MGWFYCTMGAWVGGLTEHGRDDQTEGDLEHVALEREVDEAMEDAAGSAAALVEKVVLLVGFVWEARHCLWLGRVKCSDVMVRRYLEISSRVHLIPGCHLENNYK